MSELELKEAVCGFAEASSGQSVTLRSRIASAYRLATSTWPGDGSDLWSMIAEKNSAIHEELMSDDSAMTSLERPGENFLFFGLDNLYLAFSVSLRGSEPFRETVTQILLDDLRNLAVAVGAARSWNPEGGSLYPDKAQPVLPEVDAVLDAVADAIGAEIDCPNPFSQEFGLISRRGIISQRTIQAIYQAWRIKALTESFGGRVLEIGAGLGRTAYYAIKFGVPEYTIVDLPLTNVSQALFLGQVLDPETISLQGELSSAARIRILSPQWLDGHRELFDVFFNADSLTEMSGEAAAKYAAEFARRGKVFLSINHEANTGRVCEIEALSGLRQTRSPYWFRPGYVEEQYCT